MLDEEQTPPAPDPTGSPEPPTPASVRSSERPPRTARPWPSFSVEISLRGGNPRGPYLAMFFLPILVGFAVGGLTSFGRSVSIAFYSATATIIPVLLVAMLIELALLRPVFSATGTSPAWVGAFAQAWLLGALLGLTTSLYALAAQRSTTFLVLVTAMTVASQVVFVVSFSFARAYPDLLLPWFFAPRATDNPSAE